MTSGLVIVLILVLWLVVLAPLLLGNQRPMSHTGEGFDETRVLFEGDSGQVKPRRPRMTAEQMRRVQHTSAQPRNEDYEVVTADVDEDDILLDDVPVAHHIDESRLGDSSADATADSVRYDRYDEANAQASASTAQGHAARSAADASYSAADSAEGRAVEDTATDTVEGEVVPEIAGSHAVSRETDEQNAMAGSAHRIAHPQSDEGATGADLSDEGIAAYDIDETYTSPVDLFYPGVDDSDSLVAQQPAGSASPVSAGASAADRDAVDGENLSDARRDAASEKDGPVDVQPAAAVGGANAVPVDSLDELGEFDEDDLLLDEAGGSATAGTVSDGTVSAGTVSAAGEEPSAQAALARPGTGNAVKAERGGKEAELTDEELAFAMRRRGRGGWDPEADKRASADRYQRRRRTLAGLVIAVVIAFIIGAVFRGVAWFVPVLAVAATAVYLVALRSQVKQENDLRQRRIRQLRRARLGVRNAHDEELAIPRQLRRPGAVVLEVDDESPDFDHLPVYDRHNDGDFDGPRERRTQRDDLAARRVG